jgi:hypothetical protein
MWHLIVHNALSAEIGCMESRKPGKRTTSRPSVETLGGVTRKIFSSDESTFSYGVGDE